MNELRSILEQLEVRSSGEERLIYQLVDLNLIKYRGKQQNAFTPEIEKSLENVITCFIWLYEKGWSLMPNPREAMNADEEALYDKYIDDFHIFNEFMQNNLHLKS
ncbi:hypothetical protein F9B85_00875 [Heliorestis acidaminivorans]|uniref:Uncharacterized protein n=1 Tax=Heliorestis acidaminivorans TaxID=553427 RepID=A0A6I0EWU7_9FIRM|nr:hypothetical protein [Heliorestis acidaminivorans]KAB2954279.1 hypothetical protein F9B85_00875 [Heliorestis acidaminivorans]